MKGHGTKFDRKMEEAVAAVLTQRNIDDAAKQVGISSPTLLSWMKQPEFQTAYREAKRAAFSQAIARLQQGSSAAATALLKTIVDPNTPASVRVRAAECILNHGLRAIEVEDIEARVTELEKAAEASGRQDR
jgi:transposase-like protein